MVKRHVVKEKKGDVRRLKDEVCVRLCGVCLGADARLPIFRTGGLFFNLFLFLF